MIEYYADPIPHIVVRNYFSDEELKLIWRELEFLTSERKLQPSINTASATDRQGRIIKKNYAVFLDQIFPVREISDILTATQKLWDKKFTDEASNHNFIFEYIQKSNQNACLLNYYEDENYYAPHHDAATLTVLINLYREPVAFTGGDTILGSNQDRVIPLENNRMIIFPSCALHSVTPIKFKEKQTKFSGLGRYTISQFITYGLG